MNDYNFNGCRVFRQEYGREFFQQFDIVLNALDNRQARNHVNRLCLAADVPLVESGTQGYLGQVPLIASLNSQLIINMLHGKFLHPIIMIQFCSIQVEPILKNVSECYECKPKAAQRTFAGCTIRNTPSEPIHCIVWAKHLFNQLFGLQDADEEVGILVIYLFFNYHPVEIMIDTTGFARHDGPRIRWRGRYS